MCLWVNERGKREWDKEIVGGNRELLETTQLKSSETLLRCSLFSTPFTACVYSDYVYNILNKDDLQEASCSTQWFYSLVLTSESVAGKWKEGSLEVELRHESKINSAHNLLCFLPSCALVFCGTARGSKALFLSCYRAYSTAVRMKTHFWKSQEDSSSGWSEPRKYTSLLYSEAHTGTHVLDNIHLHGHFCCRDKHLRFYQTSVSQSEWT